MRSVVLCVLCASVVNQAVGTYRVAGLGCKVNQYEAEQLSEGLAGAG